MILGFTGSRHGMTDVQRDVVAAWLRRHRPSEVHHGCCLGADQQFHRLVRDIECVTSARVVGHPSTFGRLTMPLVGFNCIEPKAYATARNWDIVKSVDILLACPSGPQVWRGSGTWQCIRCARSQQIPTLIIMPDGTCVKEGL